MHLRCSALICLVNDAKGKISVYNNAAKCQNTSCLKLPLGNQFSSVFLQLEKWVGYFIPSLQDGERKGDRQEV